MITETKSGLVQECPPDLVKLESQLIEKGHSDFATTGGTVVIRKGHTVDLATAYAGGGTADNTYRALLDHGSTNLGIEDYSVAASWEDLGTTVSWNAPGEKDAILMSALPDLHSPLNTLGHIRVETIV